MDITWSEKDDEEQYFQGKIEKQIKLFGRVQE